MKGIIGTLTISIIIGILVLGSIPVKADGGFDIVIIPSEQDITAPTLVAEYTVRVYNNGTTTLVVLLSTTCGEGDDIYGTGWDSYFIENEQESDTYGPFNVNQNDYVDVTVYHEVIYVPVPAPPPGAESNCTFYVSGEADDFPIPIDPTRYDNDEATTHFDYWV